MSSEIKYSLFLRWGALGSFIGFFGWLLYMSIFVELIVDSRIPYPQGLPVSTTFSLLLGVSYFLGSFACLGLSLINDSKVALVCFVSYIGSGIAWSCSIFNPLWSVFGWVSLGISQLVWGIVLLRNQKRFPYPLVCNTTALIVILSAFLHPIALSFIVSAFYGILRPFLPGRVGVFILMVDFGGLSAIGAVITGILLIKLSRVINEPSSILEGVY